MHQKIKHLNLIVIFTTQDKGRVHLNTVTFLQMKIWDKGLIN